MKTDTDIRKDLYSNIVLLGWNYMMQRKCCQQRLRFHERHCRRDRSEVEKDGIEFISLTEHLPQFQPWSKAWLRSSACACFSPTSLAKEASGIHDTIFQAIMKTDADIRKDLYSNIVLLGWELHVHWHWQVHGQRQEKLAEEAKELLARCRRCLHHLARGKT